MKLLQSCNLFNSQRSSSFYKSHHSKSCSPKRFYSPIGYDDNLPYSGPRTFFRILLVRHGQATSNKDKTLLTKHADHAMPLSETGIQHAALVGEQLRDFLEIQTKEDKERGLPKRYRRLWQSPFRRTRETADLIMKSAGQYIDDRREHILLSEQQFGLFEGHSLDELQKLYPLEYAYFEKCIQAEGRFWARPPLGESRFDVAQRVHQAFGSFNRDAQFHDIQDLIVVSHGVTLRAFLMMWLHKPPEWFEKETNPPLCSVRFIENNADKGYIFKGFVEDEAQKFSY